MALDDDLKAIEDAVSVARTILFLNQKQSFKVEGIDLVILRNQMPQVLVNRLGADYAAAITTIKTKAAGLPSP